ncbi:MAG TPA: hypothetical protein PLQ81_01215, partial [bacterium]|nr:hypothetical protein [bacterium]
MKKIIIVLLFISILNIPAEPGFFDKIKTKDIKTITNVIKSLNVSEEDELEIGLEASKILISKFGLYEEPILTKYISLIGSV